MCGKYQRLNFFLLFEILRIITYFVAAVSQFQQTSVKDLEINRNQCFFENNITIRCNYIPTSVPKGISRVQINDFLTPGKIIEVKTSDFQHDSWGYVTHLTMADSVHTENNLLKFNARSFSNLISLKELAMHIVSDFLLHPDTFLGLDYVTTLDMGQCAMLALDTLYSALDSANKIPLLETLILSQISYKKGPLNLDLDKFSTFGNKTNFKVAEISATQFIRINPYHLSDMKSLEVMNLSYSHLLQMPMTLPDVRSITHIRLSDIAYVVLPILDVLIPTKIENIHFDLYPLKLVSFIFAPRIVNVSGIIPSHTPIWIKNCTATFKADWNLNVQEIIAKNNHLRYIDLDVERNNFKIHSLISLDFSDNRLQFVHPNFLSILPNLKYINLSMNELSNMASDNLQLFESIFKGLLNIQEIILSENGLENIPWNMFQENTNLELIDLSHNQLSQINFDLNRAKKLQTFLLHNNQISILDSASISNLMNIPKMSVLQRNSTNLTVTFYGNLLSCAQCQTEQYLRWLLSTGLVENQNLKCYSGEESTLYINDLILKYVENICRRNLTISSICVSVLFIFIVLAISLFKIYKRRLTEEKTKKYTHALNLLSQGQNQYEFAVFLSYSSSDEEFVKHSVIRQLEASLKETTGIDRKLICAGDHDLQPGFQILDETIRLIQRSSVVIAIVSNYFCQSPYCNFELYQAVCDLKKPVLLFLYDKVDENMMSPVVKSLFKRNVRVLFEINNGEYILKNTWENVCKSIIHLIADQK